MQSEKEDEVEVSTHTREEHLANKMHTIGYGIVKTPLSEYEIARVERLLGEISRVLKHRGEG